VNYRIDPSVRRTGPGGRLVTGGSPGRLLRLRPGGAALLDRIERGEDPGPGAAVASLVDRLVDMGMVHPEPPVGSGPHRPSDVTVVVPVRDRPDGLDRLIASLGDASHVVVVDDGSVVPVQRDDVTVVRRDVTGGPAAARNDGARRVGTPLVAFVDSDCTVDPDWLGPVLAQFARPEVVAVAPRVAAAPARPGSSWVERALVGHDLLRSPLDLGEDPGPVVAGSKIGYVPAAALVVRADAFARVGGFDESMRVGEDVDLVWRLGASGRSVRYEPRSTVRHEVRPNLRSWLAQRVAYGTSAAALERRHPGSVAPVVVSPWSLAVWLPVVCGHPRTGALVASGTAVSMIRRLPDLPRTEATRLALGGHLAAGRQLARGVVRVWWPVAAAVAVPSRRARRIVLSAAAVTALDAMLGSLRSPGPRSGLMSYAALSIIDDMAYGAGVWAGCLRERSVRSLLPRGPRRRS
jgi:mycofactocin glycosyltransferase